MSGVLDVASWTEDDLKRVGWIRESVVSVFGPDGSETRKSNDIFESVRGMPPARINALPYFYFDCGNEDALCTASGKFAALLREKKIRHEYRQLPGDHSWAYWNQQVQEVIEIAAKQLRASPVK